MDTKMDTEEIHEKLKRLRRTLELISFFSSWGL